jgi:hypothetical protein
LLQIVFRQTGISIEEALTETLSSEKNNSTFCFRTNGDRTKIGAPRLHQKRQ